MKKLLGLALAVGFLAAIGLTACTPSPVPDVVNGRVTPSPGGNVNPVTGQRNEGR